MKAKPKTVTPTKESESPKPKVEEEAKTSAYVSAGYVNIKTWGVRDRAGEWIEITDSPHFAPYAAKHLTRTEAHSVFARYLNAFQLIDGCDIWACLSDEDEVFVVVKEKTDVPTPEAVPGTGGD